MKKICILLSLLMLVSSFTLSACSESDVNSEETLPQETIHSESSSSSETEEESNQTAAMVKEMFAGKNFDGYEYRVLAPGNDQHFYRSVAAGLNEVYAEEMNGVLINDAIFTRNAQAQDFLNIKISPVWNDAGDDGIHSQLNKEVLAGVTAYDTVLNRMDFMGSSMLNGDLLNLNSISTLNPSNPWWDKNIVDTFTVFDSLYFISGDINIFDDFAVEVIFFNKQLCDNNGLEYPYSDVIEGKWTIEKFYEMAKTVERDLNGDGNLISNEDIIGHTEENDHVKHWIYAMGEKSISINENSEPVVNISNERHITAVDTIFDYMVNRKMTSTSAPSGGFTTGHILFHGTMLGVINNNGFREMEQPFGVVPMPKMNEEQENYGNYVSNGWTTAYGIPMTNIGKIDTIGTIMEVICGFSTDTLRSALYDTLFAAKLVRDTESVEMLDIIFSTKAYDWAVDFEWGSRFNDLYNELYSTGVNTFSSNVASSIKAIDRIINKYFEIIELLEY